MERWINGEMDQLRDGLIEMGTRKRTDAGFLTLFGGGAGNACSTRLVSGACHVGQLREGGEAWFLLGAGEK